MVASDVFIEMSMRKKFDEIEKKSEIVDQEYVKVDDDQFRYFVCDMCPNSFTRNSHLKQHHQRVHSTVRKFICLVCSKGWLSKGELVNHMKCHTKEKKTIQNNHMCAICGRLFRKLSKQKIHMMTHTQMFKKLSIANYITWSEDKTKMRCVDCGREFKQHGHMKVHIALVHFQLQNIESLDTFDISDISKRKEPLSYDRKKIGRKEEKRVICQDCGKYYYTKHLKDHLINVHKRVSEKPPVVKQSKEFINFLTELNKEFLGHQLVLVLSFVKDLTKSSNTGQLDKIIEKGKNTSYMNVFEDLGVLKAVEGCTNKYILSGEAAPVIKADKKENVQAEIVIQKTFKKEADMVDSQIGLEETSSANISIDSKASVMTELLEDNRKCNAQVFNTGTNLNPNKKLRFKEKTSALKLKIKKGLHTTLCTICRKTFTKTSKKKIHMMTHTQMFKNLNIANKVIRSEDGTRLTCKDCGRHFDQHGHMKVHIALVHYQLHNLGSLEPLDISNMVKEIQTENGEEKKTSQPVWKLDVYFCEFCFEEFSYSSNLEKHKLVKHVGLGFKCDNCEYSNSSQEALLKHQSSKHMDKSYKDSQLS